MEPKTTGPGEKQLAQEASEVGRTFGTSETSGASHARNQTIALMPRSGAELVADFQPGIAGALISAGFTLCMLAAIIKRKR
jgi:hypothetical protein